MHQLIVEGSFRFLSRLLAWLYVKVTLATVTEVPGDGAVIANSHFSYRWSTTRSANRSLRFLDRSSDKALDDLGAGDTNYTVTTQTVI